MTRPRRLLGVVAAPLALPLALAVAGATAPAAWAGNGGPPTVVVDLACSDGRHYPVTVVDPAADPAAGRVLGDTTVLLPVAFAFEVTVLDAGGAVVEHVLTPLSPVRGRSGDHHATMTCTFTQTETERLADGTELTVRLDGTVLARVAR